MRSIKEEFEKSERNSRIIKSHKNQNLKATSQIWKDILYTVVTTRNPISMWQWPSGFLSMRELSTSKVEISGQPLKTKSGTPFQGQNLHSQPQLKHKMTLTLRYSRLNWTCIWSAGPYSKRISRRRTLWCWYNALKF